jgi:hypothetical protein
MFARGPEEAVNLPRRNQRRSSGDTKLARMSLCLSAICCFGPNIILAKALLTHRHSAVGMTQKDILKNVDEAVQ